MKSYLFATLAAIGLLAGCAGTPANPTPTEQDMGVTATGTLDVQDIAGRQVLAATTPWVKADIDHIKCAIYRDGVVTPAVTVTVVKADLGKTVTFTNLIRSQLYHVTIQAWSDSAETSRIDNLVNNAASCTTDFTTSTDPLKVVGALKLGLVDKIFSGTTSGSLITVTDGVVQDTTATEAASIN